MALSGLVLALSLAACSGESSSPTGANSTPSPSVATPTARATAVPAPGGGKITETVESRTLTTAKPVSLRAPADLGNGVTVRLAEVTAFTATAQGPGEIGGPALRVSVTIRNQSPKSLDLGSSYVTVTDSTGAPSLQLAGPPAAPLGGALAAGQSATGVYVFTVAQTARTPINVKLFYSSDAPMAQFVGGIQ